MTGDDMQKNDIKMAKKLKMKEIKFLPLPIPFFPSIHIYVL